MLQTGALPVEFRTLEQTAISATLGKDSLRKPRWRSPAGLILVCFFLLLFYRFLGVVAVLGLAVYAAPCTTILAFNVTLTLPGVAGLVLTLGVAADKYRHLRTREGRGRGVLGPSRHLTGLLPGASRPSSTRTSSPRSPR